MLQMRCKKFVLKGKNNEGKKLRVKSWGYNSAVISEHSLYSGILAEIAKPPTYNVLVTAHRHVL